MIFKVFILIIPFMSLAYAEEKLIHMVKQQEKYDYGSYKEEEFQNYEIQMDMTQFYDTVHNLEHRRIPNPNLTEIDKTYYQIYKEELTHYCENEFVSFTMFAQQNQIRHFENSVRKLKTCLSEVSEQNKLDTNIIKMEKIKQYYGDIEKCLKTTSRNFLHSAVKIKMNCLNEKLSAYENQIFIDCITSFKKALCDLHIKKNDETSEKDLNLIQEIIEDFRKIEETNSQSGERVDIKSITNVVLQEELSNQSLFTEYTNSKLSNRTQKDIQFCEGNIGAMSLQDYTLTKMKYIIFPTILSDTERQDYLKKMKNMIQYIAKNDTRYTVNYPFYESLLRDIGSISENDFKNMKTRRAFKLEEEYFAYAMRINLSGYLPLPKSLWIKEKSISEKHQNTISYEYDKDVAHIFTRTENL